MYNIGDKVSVVHEDITGEVKDLLGEKVILIDADGFERAYHQYEIAPVSTQNQFKISDEVLNKDHQERLNHLNPKTAPLKKHEIDLHIEELLDSYQNMTNHEILMKQMESCKRFVSKAIESNLPRVILIHGKGEGVLKTEIYHFLNNLKYQNGYTLTFHEAQFTEYGYGGATEVIFNP